MTLQRRNAKPAAASPPEATLPPNDADAEARLLGLLLLHPERLAEARAASVDADAFFQLPHRDVWRALGALADGGHVTDPGTLRVQLEAGGMARDAATALVSALYDSANMAADGALREHAARIVDLARRRVLVRTAAEIEGAARDLAHPLDAAIYAALESVQDIGKGNPDRPEARPLASFTRYHECDPDELLRTRYLCRGGGLLLCGPTGIGKSSFGLQCALAWAVGEACFGIEPARALRSLVIEAENDEGDLCEMRDGVLAGIDLAPDLADRAAQAVSVCREDRLTGAAFFARVVRPLLAEYRPDVLWIDPALSFLGGEANSQKDVGGFLRNMLNPLLREFGCAAVVTHHTNKPAAGNEKPNWRAGDLAYLGSGSAEWCNWARAVLAIRAVGNHSVFELHAAKRGGRLGWIDAAGERSFARHIAHDGRPGVICWRPARPEEIPATGRPKANHGADMLAVLPADGMETASWQEAAEKEHGIPRRTFYRERKSLEAGGKIFRSAVSGKWQPVRK